MFSLIAVAAVAAVSSAIPIDNGVVDYPEVTCGEHGIQVQINTQREFIGKVYIKNEVHRPECVWPMKPGPGHSYGSPQPDPAYPPAAYRRTRLYPRSKRQSYGPAKPQQYHKGDSVGIDVKFGQCNMRRQRTLDPRGVEYTFTVVASFHPLFVTKVDRAYRIRCFYMEATKTVDTQIDVSMITTQQVNEQYPMPRCFYHLKKGYEGDYARFARVGDKIVHKWECTHTAAYIYGMLVHSCYVDDGAGNKVQLVDKNGCSVDKHLVPQVVYDEKLLSAHAETHVFKYADKNNLFFQCAIQLCFKNDGGCQGITPPTCPGTHPNPPQIQHPVPVHQPAYAPAPPPEAYPPQAPPTYRPVPAAYPPNAGPPQHAPRPHDGVFEPPIAPIDPRDVPPYRDQPVAAEQTDEPSKTKQKRDVNAVDTAAPARREAVLEADVIAAPLLVLPFDADDDGEADGALIGAEELAKILPRSTRPDASAARAQAMCASPLTVSLVGALFFALLILATTLAIAVFRRSSNGAGLLGYKA